MLSDFEYGILKLNLEKRVYIMGLKDYAKKKIINKVGEVVATNTVIKAVNQIDKKNEASSLSKKAKMVKDSNMGESTVENVSTKSFSEVHQVYKLTMIEKVIAFRKNYTILDSNGNTVYTAKSDGLPKMPEMGLYNKNGDKIGRAEQGIMGNPMYTLHYMNQRIVSLYQKYSLKPKYEISENGWSIEGGVTKTTVYDNEGAIAIQIQYLLSTNRSTIIVEYMNKENEIPAILITLAMVLAYHMK